MDTFEGVRSDPGIGMSKEKLRELFEDELNTDVLTVGAQRRDGHGLGLRITKEIIESHGGRIYIQSEPGQGTRVSIVIPTGAVDE